MDTVNRTIVLFSLIGILFSLEGFGQPDYSNLNIKKPAKYENRVLGAEKSSTTKFTKVRRFMQDNITHYNYYYNANNKINEIVARAKMQHRDDYTKMLSFYNYSLDVTARDKRELDSVIYKSTSGILIHDLRNDWIDNLFMLIGKAYYFRNMPDSAYITFQYVNYAFSPKEEGGYDIPIGSNYNADQGSNAFSISTKEKRNVVQKVMTLPPSRNEAFIWLIRTHLAKGSLGQASALIETLKHDPLFPQRLHADLEEVQAWWFYKNDMFDSSAIHLEKALGNAVTRDEQARWEYLIAQMYEHADSTDKAKKYFEKAFLHTYNPVLEVYARLNFIRQSKGNEQLIRQSIDALVKMAKKDRYENYRDIIYYTVAQIELELNNKPGAELYLLKSVKYALPNSTQKSKAYLQLGDLSFEEKKYKAAKNFYDSVNEKDLAAVENPELFKDRKIALDKIVMQLVIVERQDSLQRIAAMTKADRDAFIKKLVKALRRQQGLDDEAQQGGQQNLLFNPNAKNPFGGASNASADWYFDNVNLKSKGYSDFKSKWGNRPNEDNWQLSSIVSQNLRGIPGDKFSDRGDSSAKGLKAPQVFTFESLLANVPLTPEKLKISNDSVDHALFALGKAYQEGLPDYPAAIEAYERLYSKYPESASREETLFNLFYCYKKIGDENNANRILNLLKTKYPSGKFTLLLTDPNAVIYAANAPKVEATKKYEDIYTSFIEGRFYEALAEKKSADSIYGKKYWTPQLLYIEAVYFIRERQDSIAKSELNIIIREYKGTPMGDKAQNLLNVLGRRKQIEDYLTNLKIERAKDDSDVVVDNTPAPRLVQHLDSVQKQPKQPDDTMQVAKAKIRTTPLLPAGQKSKSDSMQFAMQKLRADAAQSAKIKTDSSQLVKLRKQADSLQSAMNKMKTDSAKMAKLKMQADSINAALQKLKADSLQLASQKPKIQSAFAYNPDQPHLVVILMNKVDPVYVTETRNAFIRYNRESYGGLPIEINNTGFNDTTKMVVISGFENANAALDYADKARKLAPRNIVPWLPVGKYTFIIITNDNLGTLQNNKDLTGYQKYLNAYFPGKF